MKGTWRLFSAVLLIGFLCLSIFGCGGSVARYDPGAPTVPSGLAVLETGDGQVSLAWSAADKASAYTVYYSTSPGVTPATGTKFGTTASTNSIVTGLTNDMQYYFVVSSLNSTGESDISNEVSAIPVVPGSLAQADLTGIWRFNILVSGSNPGWMRGTLTADDTGAVTITPFLNNAGGTVAPADLFPVLLVNPSGQVRDAASPVEAQFIGILGGSQRKIIVGTMATAGGDHLFAILQKHDPLVTFSNTGDIAGFGSPSGSRRFAYSQLSSGSLKEWEYAVGQIGRNTPYEVQYAQFTNPSGSQMPGSDPLSSTTKVSAMSITASGVVTEVRGTSVGIPAPTVYISEGYMSDDKSLIVGVATDSSVPPGKFLLRIYSMCNIVPLDPVTFSLSDLAGSYAIERLVVGTSTLTASGNLAVGDGTGVVSFLSYLDSNGGTLPPVDFTLGIDPTDGYLSDVVDASLHGKMAHNKDMMVFTRTDSAGLHSLSVALKSF